LQPASINSYANVIRHESWMYGFRHNDEEAVLLFFINYLERRSGCDIGSLTE